MSNFTAQAHPTGEVAAFVLLSSDQWKTVDNPDALDHCTILRSAGRFELDALVDTTNFGFGTLQWSAVLGVTGENEIVKSALIDPLLPDYDPSVPGLGTHVRILRHFFVHSFASAVFEDAPKLHLVQTGDDQKFAVEWDVKQKVRLKGSDALVLFIHGLTANTIGDGIDWAAIGMSRTLWCE